MTAIPHDPRRSGWIPYAFIGFFVVVLIVNVAMISIGFWSWNGLAVDDAYRKGLVYNRMIEDGRRQDALGWTIDVDVASLGEGRALIELRLAGPDGNPLERAEVGLRAVRPVHAGHDFDVMLGRAGGGAYVAEVDFPLPGLWDLDIEARHGGERFRLSERVQIR